MKWYTARFADMDVYFGMTIKTRKVEDKAEHAATIIRGHSGRVNTMNTSKKNAYISFDMPKSEFEAMKDEPRELAGTRFIEENVRADNLLPQKQEIENSGGRIDERLGVHAVLLEGLVSSGLPLSGRCPRLSSRESGRG